MKRFVPLSDAQMTRAKADGDLVVAMAFSSEEPVERWWGVEILDHSEGSVRLGRLNDGAPVLYNHNPNDLRGTHEPGSVKLDKDRVLRGKVRITSATQAGRDAIGLVETKVLTKASIGYRLHTVIEQTTKRDGQKVERVIDGIAFERMLERLEAERKTDDLGLFRRELDVIAGPLVDRKDDDEPIYRVMDWEPYENSFVTIPADNTVGLGRTGNEQHGSRASRVSPPAVPAIHLKETSTMEKTEAQLAAEAEAAEKAKRERDERERMEREAREKLEQRSAIDLEQGRVRAITNLAQANKIPDQIRDTWVRQGYSLEAVSNDILKILEERGKLNPQPATRLGMTANETQRFSFARAIVAAASKDNDWSKAGFELECSKAVAQKLGRIAENHKFYVPFEVIERGVELSPERQMALAIQAAMGRRDLTAGVAGAGGFLVGTENVGFIEMLRNRSVAFRMGVRRLSGLQGNVTVPRQSAAATAAWLANEATDATESQQTFVQMSLTPKNLAAYTEVSRQLLLQSSPGVEGIVTDDIAQVVALAADLAVLEGSGAAGQPTGLALTAGIGNVAAGAASYAKVLEFQEDVATSNVTPVRGGYVTHATTASILMQKQRFTSTDTPLWEGNIWDGQVSGFPGMSSNQLAAGVIAFGDWQEGVVGEWGVLEVEVNPYANFKAGIIGVRAIYSLDVAFRRPFAFSRATGITA